MEWMIIVAVFAVGFYVGFKFNEKIMEMTFIEMIKRSGISDEQLEQLIRHWAPKMGDDADEILGTEPTTQIRIEQHEGTLYAYRKHDGVFLAQSVNSEGMIQLLADQFKDHQFTITSEDGADLIRTNPTT